MISPSPVSNLLIDALLHIEQEIAVYAKGPTVAKLARLCGIEKERCERVIDDLTGKELAHRTKGKGSRNPARVVLTANGLREAWRNQGQRSKPFQTMWGRDQASRPHGRAEFSWRQRKAS